MSKHAFLLQCNKTDQKVIDAYDRLFKGTQGLGDCLILYHMLDAAQQMPQARATYTFDDDMLHAVNYIPISFSLLPGSNHFPLLKFYTEHKEYDYYWLVENDVFFNGDWRDFFDAFTNEKADFISTHIQHYKQIPYWYWWRTLANTEDVVPMEERLRSFNPIYRISRGALATIDAALTAGWVGHHEVLLPTVLQLSGHSLLDIGGHGPFTGAAYINRFYDDIHIPADGRLLTGSMRWRPNHEDIGQADGKLYHPVK